MKLLAIPAAVFCLELLGLSVATACVYEPSIPQPTPASAAPNTVAPYTAEELCSIAEQHLKSAQVLALIPREHAHALQRLEQAVERALQGLKKISHQDPLLRRFKTLTSAIYTEVQLLEIEDDSSYSLQAADSTLVSNVKLLQGRIMAKLVELRRTLTAQEASTKR